MEMTTGKAKKEKENTKQQKKQFVKDLRVGDPVKGTFAVRNKEPPRDYRNKTGKFFFLEVGDRTGDIGLKYWGGKDPALTERIYKSFEVGDVIKVTGMVVDDKYDDKLVIKLDEGNIIRRTTEEIDVMDYLRSTDRNPDVLFQEIMDAVTSVTEPHLMALLDSFFNDEEFVKEFKLAPSAMVHHHNYVGGNMEHVVGVLEICEALTTMYDELDRDLLITGALLHDIGKLRTYRMSTSIDMTDEGRFMSHSQVGERMVRARIQEIEGFPEDLAMKLCHMILKHMGSFESSEITGMRIPEAIALHVADFADAQVKEFLQERDRGREAEAGNWYYSRTFGGQIYLK
jgi:3'-5' exoribonuclease